MLAAIEAGADDVVRDGDTWTVTTDPSSVYDVRQALEDAGFTIESADTPMVSDNLVPIADRRRGSQGLADRRGARRQ